MLRKPVTRDILILLAFSAVTVVAAFQLPRVEVDGSIDAFFPSNHPVIETNEEIELTFGSLDSIVMAVTLNFGTVFEPEVLALVDTLTTSLAAVDSVDSVTSLTNIDYITSDGDQMTVVPLVESRDADGIRAALRRTTEWAEVYVGSVVSADLKTTALVVQPRPGADQAELGRIYAAVRRLAEENQSANLSIRIAGAQVYEEEIARSVASDVKYLIPAAAALVILVLAVAFRRFLGVVFPILGIVVAGVWVVGVIGAAGITLTMATLLVPVLLLVVGSAYGIHVMQHFYENLSRAEGFVTADRIVEIVRSGIGAVRRPVILAGVTTAAGFLAQLSSPLGPFRVFGVLSAVGIGAALLNALVLIPALLRLRYRNGVDAAAFHRVRPWAQPARVRTLPSRLEHLVAHGRLAAVGISLALLAATALAIPNIRVGTNLANFFRPSSRVARDATAINSELGGTGIVSVEISAPQPGDILRSDFLLDLQQFEVYLADLYPEVTGVRTLVPSITRINSILNYDTVPYREVAQEEPAFDFFADAGFFADTTATSNGLPGGGDGAPPDVTAPPGYASSGALDLPALAGGDAEEILETAMLSAGVGADAQHVIREILAARNFHGAAFNEIPADPAKYGLATEEDLKDLVAQYLVLYSGNLDMFIDDAIEPGKTLVTVQINDENRDVLMAIRRDIRAYWDYHLDDGWHASIGGPSTLVLVLSELVTRSQYLSLAGALVVVWAIVALMFRSPLAGIFGLIPVAFALIGIFLSMAIFGFYLDVVTSVLAALAIGIGVDYGIHLMSAYQRALRAGSSNPLDVVYRTTGSAILFNAASVAVGFLSLLVSQFVPIRQVGILFTVSMVFAGAASLIILPMALEYFSPRFISPDRTDRRKKQNRRHHETSRNRILGVALPAAGHDGPG